MSRVRAYSLWINLNWTLPDVRWQHTYGGYHPHLFQDMVLNFEKAFPALAKEMHQEESEKEPVDDWTPVRMPTVVDHLQRCSCADDALEVIDFFEEKGELSLEAADKMRLQLMDMGVESFGQRERGEYEKHGIR